MPTLYSKLLPPDSIEEARDRALDLRDMLIEIDAKLVEAKCNEKEDPELRNNLEHQRWKHRAKDAKIHYTNEFQYLVEWIRQAKELPQEGLNDALTLLLVAYRQLTEFKKKVASSNENAKLLDAIKDLLELEGLGVEDERQNVASKPPKEDSGDDPRLIRISH